MFRNLKAEMVRNGVNTDWAVGTTGLSWFILIE